jgi:translocation and assembly module TamB
VVIKRPGTGQAKPSAPARLLSVNLEADLGRNFHFRGAGVESRLVGAVKFAPRGAGLPRATGSIRTRDGRFDAYGQKLDIERGILNFQGLIDNPGLNIRAVRRNLPVEAGVEVTGTARRPIVRLVSDPDVPDAEKLSWLVLGQAPRSTAGAGRFGAAGSRADDARRPGRRTAEGRFSAGWVSTSSASAVARSAVRASG